MHVHISSAQPNLNTHYPSLSSLLGDSLQVERRQRRVLPQHGSQRRRSILPEAARCKKRRRRRRKNSSVSLWLILSSALLLNEVLPR